MEFCYVLQPQNAVAIGIESASPLARVVLPEVFPEISTLSPRRTYPVRISACALVRVSRSVKSLIVKFREVKLRNGHHRVGIHN